MRLGSVTPDEINRQRDLGWPNFGPEDYCHRCGRPNVVWFVDNAVWRSAFPHDSYSDEHAQTYSANERATQGIVCPPCFVDLYETATGKRPVWELRVDESPPTDLVEIVSTVLEHNPHAMPAYLAHRIGQLLAEQEAAS